MPLETITFEIAEELPERVERIIRVGERRILDFAQQRHDGELTGFVPADHTLVAQALAGLRGHPLLAGECFVEWGSGLGILTSVAAELGYEAYGIEILPELVAAAEELAHEMDVDSQFACGSCVSPEAQDTIECGGEGFWIGGGGQDGHDLLDLAPQDADLVYAYPWPGEGVLFEQLFERTAGSGALFLSYNGVEGLRLLRKS